MGHQVSAVRPVPRPMQCKHVQHGFADGGSLEPSGSVEVAITNPGLDTWPAHTRVDVCAMCLGMVIGFVIREVAACIHTNASPASIANTWKCRDCGAVFQRKAER